MTMDNSIRIENEGVKYPDLDSVLTFRNVLRARREEAYEKVREEGHKEIVLHMAGLGVESDEISRLTGLKREFVEQAKFNGIG